jgi:hypothetical protein
MGLGLNVGELLRCDLLGHWLPVHLRGLNLASWRVPSRGGLNLWVAPMVAGTPTMDCFLTADPVHVLGCSSSRAECALQIPLCAPAAWELLIALGLSLCTVAARDGGSTSRLWYYTLDWQAFLVVLVSSVDSVVSLEQVPVGLVRTLLEEKRRGKRSASTEKRWDSRRTAEQSSYDK